MAEQLEAKQEAVMARIDPKRTMRWEAPFASRPEGFRNKAKLVVGGSLASPTLGILDEHQRGVDLPDCRLYPPALRAALPVLRRWIQRAGLRPYSVPERRGELKYLLLTLDPPSGRFMLRLVLRSRAPLERLRRALPWLRQRLPALALVSVNLQPRHAAIVEGEVEIPLGPQPRLALHVNGLRLWLQPGGFWQTNTEVAAALYRTARAWADGLRPRTVLDLYCGIGGFAHHLAAPGREVEGLELHPAAVAAAAAVTHPPTTPPPRFAVADAEGLDPKRLAGRDLVVVNPPRRGLGEALCASLQRARPRWLLYSSCNLDSLARDLARLVGYRGKRARLFDMFPHTPHAEVLVLLRAIDDGAPEPCPAEPAA